MNYDALLALMASIIILLTGFRVWLLDTHRHQYRVFFILALLLVWMSFGWYEMAQTRDPVLAQYWRDSQAIWTFITPLITYMIYVFADDQTRQKLSKQTWYLSFFIIFGLGLFFFYLEFFTDQGHGKVTLLESGVWSLKINPDSNYHLLRGAWTVACYVPTVIIMYLTYRSEKIKRIRNWKLAIAVLLLVGLVGTTLQNYIFPYFGIMMPINESANTLVATLFFGWAMSDFKLFDYDASPNFEELVRKMPDLIILANKRWRVQRLNPAAALFFKQKELLERPLLLRELFSAEWTEEIERKITKEDRIVDLTLTSLEGEKRNYHFSSSPVRNRRGDTIGHLLLGRDMTSYHQALEASRENARKLKQSNKAFDRLAYIDSHDMKEPARTISNFVGLLKRQLKKEHIEEVGDHLHYLERSSHRLHHVIESILDFSRLSKTADEADTVYLDVNSLIEEVLLDMQHLLESKNVTVKVDTLPSIFAKETLLKLLFTNLISNGAKFNDRANPEIHINCFKQNGQDVFVVKDNGIGIDPEFQEQIFEMFKRLHSWSDIEGTGIGLAICQRIVEDAGGKIWVESDGKNGTSFSFTLKSIVPETVEMMMPKA